MLDIPSISAIAAAAGVLVGVVLTVLELRHLVKQRQTDLLMRLCSVWQTKDWLEAWSVVDGSDLNKILEEKRVVETNEVVLFFDEIGVLLQMRLVDIELVEKLLHGHAIRIWEKLKPGIEGYRKLRNDPNLVAGFEYLYNEMKKRERRGA